MVVRFRDEESYLEATLRAVRAQKVSGEFEIVAVDNNSQDGSRRIAERWADRVLPLTTYSPGRALNLAIEHARGRNITVLSAHTIPAGRDWLAKLCDHMDVQNLAGVYGGQLYNIQSRFLDKRILDAFSTLEPREELCDSDFWNANSMFPRAVWETQRFDESVFELEDHYWTKCLLPRGHVVHFEPQALVYHYSHIDRLDREFLPPSKLTDEERIDRALAELESPEAGWVRCMVAGLTLSSLTRTPSIQRAVPSLGRLLTKCSDFDVRWRMAQALGKIPTREAVSYLVTALADPSLYPRDEAAWSLARLGALAVEAVEQSSLALSTDCRPFAALALGRSGVRRAELLAIDLLADGLASVSPQERRDAAYFAGEVAGTAGAEQLIPGLAALLSETPELTMVGCWALGCFADRAVEFLAPIARHAIQHLDPLVRYEAIVAVGKHALASHDSGTVLAPLLAACDDPVGRVRYGAVQSLRLLAENGCSTAVPESSDDPDFGVRFELELLETALRTHIDSPCHSQGAHRQQRRIVGSPKP